MGRQGDCIWIVRKDGKRAIVPLQVWENGLKLDKDWKIENRPLLETPELKIEPVLIEKPKVEPKVEEPVPVPAPVVAPPASEPEKPKRKYTRKKKA